MRAHILFAGFSKVICKSVLSHQHFKLRIRPWQVLQVHHPASHGGEADAPKKPPAPDRHEIACLGLWRFHFYLSWLKKISRRIRAREGPPSLVHPPPASIHTHTVGSQVNWGGVSGCSWVAFSGQGHPTHSCASSSPGPTGGGGGAGRASLKASILKKRCWSEEHPPTPTPTRPSINAAAAAAAAGASLGRRLLLIWSPARGGGGGQPTLLVTEGLKQ